MRRWKVTLAIVALEACSFDSSGLLDEAAEGGTGPVPGDSTGGLDSGLPGMESAAVDEGVATGLPKPGDEGGTRGGHSGSGGPIESGVTSGSDEVSPTEGDGTGFAEGTVGTDGVTVAVDEANEGVEVGEAEAAGDGTESTTVVTDPCDDAPAFASLLFVAQAARRNMVLDDNDGPPDFEGDEVLYAEQDSENGQRGAATFSFDLACPSELFVWGLVFDPLIVTANADSFDWELDGSDVGVWNFGCEGENRDWQWERFHVLLSESQCRFEPFVESVAAGPHEIRILDREDQFGSAPPARIAAIAVTNDDQFDPESIYPVTN